MQNLWLKLWNRDKFIKKEIEDNYKNNIKKNKCRAIRSYEAKSLTNQMSKDEIKKKKSITQKDLKIKGEKNIN